MFKLHTSLRGKAAGMLVIAATLGACGTALSESAQGTGSDAGSAGASQVTSILNSGVLTEHPTSDDGAVKFLFDPLYDDHYGTLAELTPELIEAIIAGAPPYDRVDAVFVTHAHGDHFSVSLLTRMLQTQDQFTLVLPEQAFKELREGPEWDPVFEERVHIVSLENGEASEPFTIAGAQVDAFQIPHSGWPDRHTHIDNLTFRVSVPGKAGSVSRVFHVGDADPADEHYVPLQEELSAKRSGLAIVPFWFTRRDDVDQIIDETLNSEGMVAVHVPVKVPKALEEGEWTYFSKAGQVLEIPATE